jgi:hypothetical protein
MVEYLSKQAFCYGDGVQGDVIVVLPCDVWVEFEILLNSDFDFNTA